MVRIKPKLNSKKSMFRAIQLGMLSSLLLTSFAGLSRVSAADDWQMVDDSSSTRPSGQNQAPVIKAPSGAATWEQLVDYGEKLLAAGRAAEAEKPMVAATGMAKKFGPLDPRLASSYDNLGLVYQKLGRSKEAERLFLEALAIDKQIFGRKHATVSRDMLNLGILYTETGRYADAEAFFKVAIAIDEEMGDAEHPYVAIDLENYAALLRKTNRAAEAARLEARVKHINDKLHAQGLAESGAKLIAIGQQHFLAGRFAEAEKAFMQASKQAQSLGPDNVMLATILNSLAAVYGGQGRYADAEKFCTQALTLDLKSFGNAHPAIIRDLNNLALIYDREGKNLESERAHITALDLSQKIFGPDNPNSVVGLQNYANLLRKLGRSREAAQLERRIAGINFKQRALAGRAQSPQ